jgi:glycosyltransferase involved in cell wall biosynthesis
LDDPDFISRVDRFVFVSNWQQAGFIDRFSIPEDKCSVLKNAIDPIQYIPKPPSNRVILTYTSMPNRGLEVLMDAFDYLNPKDVELRVFSSDIIYGVQYHQQVGRYHEQLFRRCKSTRGVVYKGYCTNQAVRKSLQDTHILSYPSTFPETSCISAIEAGSAGCKIVTTRYGALPETCGEFAVYTDYTSDHATLVKTYAEALQHEIDLARIGTNTKNQRDWFNTTYSWSTRALQWKELIDSCVK